MRRVLAFSFFVCIVWGNPFMREVIVLSILIGVIWALSWGIAILAGGSLFAIEEIRKVLFPRLFTLGKWRPL